jgi:hypothetical protein
MLLLNSANIIGVVVFLLPFRPDTGYCFDQNLRYVRIIFWIILGSSPSTSFNTTHVVNVSDDRQSSLEIGESTDARRL